MQGSPVPGPIGSTSLFADLDVQVELDAPLAQHTWYGVGGHADALVRPGSMQALATLLQRCARQAVPVRVLGSGANLLVDDEGVEGVVLKLDTPAFQEFGLNAQGGPHAVRVGAGRDLSRTTNECVRHGLAGLEPMTGIPASVGGALRMNAGGRYGDIAAAVHSVALVTWQGEERIYPRAEIPFDYRHSGLPAGVIVWGIFTLAPADPVALRQRVKEISAYKASVQPLRAHSAGCMFKNPLDPATGQRVSAGKLIDQAGLKGLRVGAAEVSAQHGNFLTTEPGARAADLMALAAEVADKVWERMGVRLEREVVFWRRGQT
jgi:UDP-N-acetylmuramate dehydrogenase